jgi:hypothetical protein
MSTTAATQAKPAAGPPPTAPLSVTDLAAALACAGCFSAWMIGDGAPGSLIIPLVFAVLCLSFLFAGRAFLKAIDVLPKNGGRFPLSFLTGYFIINSLLYLLAVLSPFRIATNFIAVLVVLILVVISSERGRPRLLWTVPGSGAGLACVLVSLVAATLWSQDSLRPIVAIDRTLVFLPWIDSFFHACQIRMLRGSHGFGSFESIKMAGQPAGFYHYAAYTIPALLSAASAVSALDAYTRFMVPFGCFLTGLAAFSLVQSWWGARAGLAATVALLLLPDASGQWFGNKWLSYHWLQQISPAGSYGVALLALCWLLMIKGCAAGRPLLLAVSYLLAACSIEYKAHIFVANALLLWVFPAFFARNLRWWARASWLALALASFLAATRLAAYLPRAPLLRLDFSSITVYLAKVAHNFDNDTLRWMFSASSPGSGLVREACRGAALLFLGTFGLFGLACVALTLNFILRNRRVPDAKPASVVNDRGRVSSKPGRARTSSPPGRTTAGPFAEVSPAVLFFPIIMIANYLCMSLGLAIDPRNAAHSEELLHRPLVWAYFAVSSWVGGALVAGFPWRRLPRPVTVIGAVPIAVVLLAVPAYYGHNVQEGPEWGKQLTSLPLPRSLADCALYVRNHSGSDDLLQCQGNDPTLFVSAMSERRAYAVAYSGEAPDAVLSNRLSQVADFEQLTDAEAIRQFALEHRIRWYVLPPGARVAWPNAFVADPDYSSDGFRVYRFW